jgi:hypothetical protein
MAEVNQTVTTPVAGPTPGSAAAPSLLNKIKSNLQAISSQPAGLGTALDQTSAIQQVSRASTGKLMGPETGPARSRQAVLATTDTIQQAQQSLIDKAQMQTIGQMQKMEAIQADEDFKNNLMTEEQLNTREKMLGIKKDILTEFTNKARTLDLSKDRARLEQLGFVSRLANDKYLNELQNQARIANLSDEATFQEELIRTTFAQEEGLFRSSMEFRALIQADAREFQEQLASISRDFAEEMAAAENQRFRESIRWAGISSLIATLAGETAGQQFESEIAAVQKNAIQSAQPYAGPTKFGQTARPSYAKGLSFDPTQVVRGSGEALEAAGAYD